FGDPGRYACLRIRIDDEGLEPARLEQGARGREVDLSILVLDAERGEPALRLRACIPWAWSGERLLTGKITPALDCVLITLVDTESDFGSEGPHRLDRRALRVRLEAFEARDVVRVLIEADVGTVEAVEFVGRKALDRQDGAGGRLNGDV